MLLSRYYGTAHHSLGNYLAQISGQGPGYATQHDCPTYTPFRATRADAAPGQVVGNGCVYPARVKTLAGQLQRGRAELARLHGGHEPPMPAPRARPARPLAAARPGPQYATRHNPFVYFRSITRRPAYCRRRDVRALAPDPRTSEASGRRRGR